MPISLHNSLTRRIEPFAPLDPQRVTVYLCGPTVYSFVHIGNARGPVVFDVLVRLLRRHYPKVVYARNITDVDDKINAAAIDRGVAISTITDRFTAAYRDDMATLGIAPPDIEPRATAHIGEIITMIETLIANGHAYVAESHVLFDVDSYADYGTLSGRNIDDMIAGARIEIAPYKKNPADFVLWKPSTPELPGWDSPWGIGRPGWHIECSAMSAAHLGETIDIHAGGIDLQFPHHENEIAQSTCAHGGKVFARVWMHNGMLTFGGRKMSKSLGNVLNVHDLLKQHPPEALRLLLLRGHYRQPLDWSGSAITQAVSTLDGWYRVLRDLEVVELPAGALPVPERVEAALCDDLNTPQALAELSKLADMARQSASSETKAALLGGGALLGLLQQVPDSALRWRPADQTIKPVTTSSGFKFGESVSVEVITFEEQVNDLLEKRNSARAEKNWALADEFRKQLASMDVAIEDAPQGTRWSVVKG